MKKWNILGKRKKEKGEIEDVVHVLLENRGFTTKKQIEEFLHPKEPHALTPKDVEIDERSFYKAMARIKKAIHDKASIVVYADYDADGITAGAIMWEALHALGAKVMPYIPHRVEEGYGLSKKGIDAVCEKYHPTLIITVDHGITAWEKVQYAKTLGIDVIVTDHHVKPDKLPGCPIVHTTKLSGAGISWFIADKLLPKKDNELLALAAIGTIADMVPLIGPNRSIAKYGLKAINETKRIGLDALIVDTKLTKGALGTYEISHMLAPRLNAMGRLVHAMDALRLLCTKQKDKAELLAQKLGLTNKERQQLTTETTVHALQDLALRTQGEVLRKLLFVVHESYNQGVIGLVAGKLVEEYYRPAIVVAKGEHVSKASARSIAGFNIVEAIRSCSDLLVDVGGHPMAAGFTVETKNLLLLQERLEHVAHKSLDDTMLMRSLRIDIEIPIDEITETLWQKMRNFEPFGFGNPEPVFATCGILVDNARLVGAEGKHLKLRITSDISHLTFDAIGFGMGEWFGKLKHGTVIDIAYSIDMNIWNGNRKLQLKLKDIKSPLSSGAPEP